MPQMRASTLTQMISGTKSENSGKVIFTHEKKVCLQNDATVAGISAGNSK
jgi:ABC-type sugar transport system ATPase subunit